MIIAVASGKGGTGKTFFATNLFYTLYNQGIPCQLVDCDAEAPNTLIFFQAKQLAATHVTQNIPVIDANRCTFCGQCVEYCQNNAIFMLPNFRAIKVMDELCHGCGACSVACKFGAVEEKPFILGQVSTHSLNGKTDIIEAKMKIGGMTPVPVIKAAIRSIDRSAEFVILDAPPGTSCPFIHTVNAADFVVLVTEPTPFGLSDLRQSTEVLKEMDKPFGVVINRAGIGNEEVEAFLQQEHIPLLAKIPYAREIAGSYSNGIIVSEIDAEFRQQIAGITQKITN